MYGGLFSGGGREGNLKPTEPSVTYEAAPSNYRTPEGKAAKGLVASLDKMSFNEGLFADFTVSEGGPGMRRRILNVALGIIRRYASEWESGVSQDEVSRDAMRLMDTLRQFKM